MDKLVYLFELDSVRNSKEEIEIAHRALCDEIVKNGNQVVLSFNQLTDSLAILSALFNEDTYNDFMTLAEHGSILVSRSAGCKTASEFVQNSFKRCLNANLESGGSTFVFSGLPVEKGETELLKQLLDCFIHDDISELEKVRKINQEEIHRFKYLEKYVKLMLAISIKSEITLQPKERGSHGMHDFILDMLEMYADTPDKDSESNLDSALLADVKKALVIIKDIEQELVRQSEVGNAIVSGKRSNWYTELGKKRVELNDPKLYLEESLVDLCYLYSLEDGIIDVSKHYSPEPASYRKDFEHRLVDLLEMKKTRTVSTSRDIVIDYYADELPKPDFSQAVICVESARPKRHTTTRGVTQDKNRYHEDKYLGQHYERHYARERFKWKCEVGLNLLYTLRGITLLVLTFLVTNVAIDTIQDLAIENLILMTNFQENMIFSIFVNVFLKIILFALLNSIVMEIFHVHDILDSAKKFRSVTKNLLSIIFSGESSSYRRVDEDE